MELVLVHRIGGVQIHQHEVGVVAGLQLALGQTQDLCRAGAHQVDQQFQRQALLLAELGVADAEGRLAAHHTGHALELVLFRVGCVVGGDGIHHAGADGLNEGGHIVCGADGRIDAVVAGVLGEPQVVGGHLAGDGGPAQLGHLDGLDGTAGGHMAHVEPGLVILAQPAVAHRLDILGQAVVPGADLHILGVAHHGDVPLGADGEGPRHGGVVLHTVAVLGDEPDAGGQGLEVVQRLAIKVLGDGDGLVHIAQAHLCGLLLHHCGLRSRRADGLGVGHQVDEGVAARSRCTAACLDVLLIFKARCAPVAVQIDEGGQHGKPPGIQNDLVLPGQSLQILADRRDLSVPDEQLHGASFRVDSVYKQHGTIPPCFWRALDWAKKRTFPQMEKFESRKKGNTEPTAKKAAN